MNINKKLVCRILDHLPLIKTDTLGSVTSNVTQNVTSNVTTNVATGNGIWIKRKKHSKYVSFAVGKVWWGDV